MLAVSRTAGVASDPGRPYLIVQGCRTDIEVLFDHQPHISDLLDGRPLRPAATGRCTDRVAGMNVLECVGDGSFTVPEINVRLKAKKRRMAGGQNEMGKLSKSWLCVIALEVISALIKVRLNEA